MSKGLKFILALSAVAVIFLIFVFVVIFSGKKIGQPLSETEALALANRMENSQAMAIAAVGKETVRPIGEADNIDGNNEAPVKLIVYSDYSCPFCSAFNETLKQVKKEFGDRIVIAYRHFILPGSLMTSALAAECAAEQGKFLSMKDRLFFEADVRSAGKSIKLKMEKFDRCMDEGGYEDKIALEIEEARKLGVIGTPAVFVNNDYFPGALPFDDFQDSQGNKQEGLKNIVLKRLQ